MNILIGFARLKSLRFPSEHYIHTIVNEAFHRELTVLNENDEISLVHLKAFLLTTDSIRIYFASLGTIVVTRDVTKLLEQRTEILKEMAVLKSEIQQLADQVQDYEADASGYHIERGGDYRLLQLHADLTEPDGNPTKKLATVNISLIAWLDRSMPSEEQLLRRHARHRAVHGAVDFIVIEDAFVFSNGCRPSDSISGMYSFETAFRNKWALLRRQRHPYDGELFLDVDLLEDLFEHVGITLSDHDTNDCLAKTRTNQVNKYLCRDILEWYYFFSQEKQIYFPRWFYELEALRNGYQKINSMIETSMKIILDQHKLLAPLSEHRLFYHKYLNPFRSVSDTTKSISSAHVNSLFKERVEVSSSHFNFIFSIKAADSENQIRTVSRSQTNKSTPAASRRTTPAVSSRRGGNSTATTIARVDSLLETVAEEKAQHRSKYRSAMHFVMCAESGHTTSTPISDERGRLSGPVSELTSLKVTSHFNQKRSKASLKHILSGEAEKAHGALWFNLLVKSGASEAELTIVLETAMNFFKAIPWEFHQDIYSSVEGEVFYLHSSDAINTTGNQRIVMIALLHEKDGWKNLESSLPPDIFMTRAFKSIDFSICLHQSLTELYAQSLDYVEYLSRLFGPQEDELGEEGMNPLRFAKSCRHAKKVIEDQLSSIDTTDLESARTALEARGYAISGSKAEVLSRYRIMLQQQLERIGFGEMSLFGKRMCLEIFKQFDKDNDGALSVHEMNDLLKGMKQSTIYDAQEYKNLNLSFGFHTNLEGNLTLQGFLAYFESFGYLGNSIEILGLGSLNDSIKGSIYGDLEIIDGCFGSLYSLCEEPTYAQLALKNYLLFLSNLKDAVFKIDVTKVEELFTPIFSDPSLEWLRSPGFLARWIHSIEQWLADGDEGFIRKLRLASHELFNNYEIFDNHFKHLAASYKELSTIDRIEFVSKLEGGLPPIIRTKVSTYYMKVSIGIQCNVLYI
jgi:hypothetical protein